MVWSSLALLWALSAATASPALETIAELPERPGALAVSGTHLFVAMHPLGQPETKVLELLPGGRRQPYPSGVVGRGFGAVTALHVDGGGSLWILDAGGERQGPSVIGWNTVDERRLRSVRVPRRVLVPNSLLTALAVDRARGLVYLADRTRADWVGDSHPALIVLSLTSGEARRVLEDHPALEPDSVPVVVDRRPVAHRNLDGTVEKLRLGVSQLAVDPSGTWLYLAGLNGGTVWRVRTADLAEADLAVSELATRVEPHADRPPGNGIAADDAGRVFVTDVETHALGLSTPAGYEILVEDPRLQWPDGLALGADGSLYVTVNQLNLHPALNRGEELSRPPYLVLRYQRPAAPGPSREPPVAGDAGSVPAPRRPGVDAARPPRGQSPDKE